MQLNGWDRALKVTADGNGLVGHAGAVLLRKAADQLGLTAGLSAALRGKGSSPLLDRGVVLVSLAMAIALGDAPSGPTARRALDLAGNPRMLERIARARAKARGRAWELIEATPAGFPWLAVAGKTLAGWLVIDMDATLVTARSDQEGAAPTWKKGYGFHPLGAHTEYSHERIHTWLENWLPSLPGIS
jgi:Transposase DDE domain group 1